MLSFWGMMSLMLGQGPVAWDAQIHTLGENHRRALAIVRKSANLITYNLNRHSKPIHPATNKSLDASLLSDNLFITDSGKSITDEAYEAVKAAGHWHAQWVVYKDIAILMSVKNISSVIQQVLTEAKIPLR